MLVISLSIFMAVSLASFLFLAKYWEIKRRNQRLERFKIGAIEEQEKIELSEGRLSAAQRFLSRLGRYIPENRQSKVELELERANLPLKAAEFIALNLLAGIVPLALFTLSGQILYGLLFSLMGLFLPQLYLRMLQVRRQQKFATQIPDALVMMANALKAGYSFLQSMELVSREMAEPISQEFAKCLKEMNLGMTTEQSLQAMVQRVDSEDLDLVITAVLIQRQVGGNLSEILDSIAFTIRERIRIKGEIRTLTAQGRISGLVIGALPVGLTAFIFMLNPSYITPLFTEPLGRMMLVVGVVGQIIAAFIIRKIVDVQV